MNRAPSLLLLLLVIITTFFSAACAGTPSGREEQDRTVQPSPVESREALAAADPDYDPGVNALVHKGWSVSMPPYWRATVDHSGKGSYLFRLSHDLVRISVQPVNFGFEYDRSMLTGYAEDRLNRIGKAVRNEKVEALPLSRGGSITVWDVERDAGGLHRVILEENEQGLFEWRITISGKRQELYTDAVMKIFHSADLQENKEISRRIQESGFEFSSQGGLWRWYGDMDQGFLLESCINENEPYIFLSITDYESLKEVYHKTEEWLEAKKQNSNEVRTMALSFSGRPYRTRLWIQDENEKLKEVLFFVEEEDPVMFFLDMRKRKGMDYDVDAFLGGDSFKNLLDYSIKLPEAGL